jgi:hypothetical protein
MGRKRRPREADPGLVHAVYQVYDRGNADSGANGSRRSAFLPDSSRRTDILVCRQ